MEIYLNSADYYRRLYNTVTSKRAKEIVNVTKKEEIKNKIKDEPGCYTLGFTKEVKQWFIDYFKEGYLRLIKFKEEENDKYFDI